MAYTCDLGSGQHLYLDNLGPNTAVTLTSSSAGQQQQSGSQFTTGAWTRPPELFRTGQSVVVKLTTAQGPYYLQFQGNQWGSSTSGPNLVGAQQMQTSQVAAMPGPPMEPMQPMQPMTFTNPASSPSPAPEPAPPMQPMQPLQPMTLGNMTMSANPMEMRMGNMAMSIGQTAASTSAAPANEPKAKFCSQCGTPVKPSDRFCANCGHQLGT